MTKNIKTAAVINARARNLLQEDLRENYPGTNGTPLNNSAAAPADWDKAQRLAAIVNDSNDALTLQDLAGNILAWNHGAELMYGWTEAEALAMNILETIPEPRRKEASALSSRIADGETITSFESQRITKCKQEIEVWLTLTALKNRDQKVYAIASTERDITERKRKESQKEIYFQETDLAKVKALTGLLPICASCKQIRDANGDWHQVESYIRDRSEATFSHSLCPQCVNKFYPDCRARAEGTPKARKTSVAAAQNLIRIPRT